MQVDYERLAELLEEPLQPVVPDRIRLRRDGATLTMWTEGFQGLTLLSLTYNAHVNVSGQVEESLEDPIGNLLTQVADEASEATTDRYECDFAFGGDVIRLWFGLAPPTPATNEWRDVLPELPAIPLSEFVAPRSS
jgi:hypothetical protein